MTRTPTATPRALLLAASLALAGGMAQAADTYDTPQAAGEASTMTNGQPNMSTDNAESPTVWVYSVPTVPYTAIMGSGPGVVYYEYVYPASLYSPERSGASETSNVPLRAGEASTMTNGAPNVSTRN